MVLQGEFHPDFGQVAETLIQLLPKRTAGGAALCIYHRGEKVVDVWGGTRDREGNPWQADTVAFSASTTKGVTSTLMHVLVDKGLAHYDDRISQYWPAFACNGKQDITIRHVMSHRSGLYNIADQGFSIEAFWDWETALKVMEQATPVHEPGLHSAYHGLNYGHLLGGVIEKITGRPFQSLLQEWIAEPLGLDGLYIGMPDTELHRLAKLISLDGNIGKALKGYQRLPVRVREWLHRLTLLVGADFTHFAKALAPDFVDQISFNDPRAMQAVIPAANGAFTARSLARMYAAIACGGEIDGQRILSRERVAIMNERQGRGRDKVINFPMGWRLGYHQVFTFGQMPSQAFGHFGFGGSGAWCDTGRQLSVALTLNTGVGTPMGDLRIVRISGDVLRCADRREAWRREKPMQDCPAAQSV
jgi:CubicO group peptidase (beta-lactamase class C family)